MADKIIDVRLKQKYDTEANWTSANPVLLAGEMAISSDKNGAYKVGNGTSKWSELSYAKQSLTKTDVTDALGYTPPTTNTTYSTGTATRAGITKLYQETGVHTDGTMTQVAITEALDDKANASHNHEASDINLPTGTNGVLYNNNGDIAVSAVTYTELSYLDGVNANVQNQLNGKAASSHTHNYAGSGSAGGSANSAVKLDSSAGSATQPVYFSGGKPVACTYTLEKSVPSNAVFTDTNTWIALKGATASTAGTAGYVPAPAAGKQNSFLRGDGTWAVPPNTTYNVATTSANGLMSSSDKTKLDGIAKGANNYVLPMASSSTLGGVKTTSTVTSTSGYTACPIISGVPYYKSGSSVSVMGGATSSAAGKQGLVPAPSAGFQSRYLRGDATWGGVATTSSDGLMSSTQVNQLNNVVNKVNELNSKTAIILNSDSESQVSFDCTQTAKYFIVVQSSGTMGDNGLGPVVFTIAPNYNMDNLKVVTIFQNNEINPDITISNNVITMRFKTGDDYISYFKALIFRF